MSSTRGFFDGKPLLVVIDLQDKLLNLVKSRDQIIESNKMLIRFFIENNIPVIATKQIKLGEINTEIMRELGNSPIIEKETFSCFGNTEFREYLEKLKPNILIITGIETHICVLSTALDAVREGYRVIVPPDTVGSQVVEDHEYALKYMANKGIDVLPSESIVYGMMVSPRHKSFKVVLDYVKRRRKTYTKPSK